MRKSKYSEQEEAIVVKFIVSTTCNTVGVKESDIRRKNRRQHVFICRNIIYSLLKEVGISSVRSGDLICGHDHTTILHNINSLKNDIETNDKIKKLYQDVRAKVFRPLIFELPKIENNSQFIAAKN